MTIIINRNQKIAGTHYTENQQLTLGNTTETEWVNKGWARWAPGSEPAQPVPVMAIQSTSAQGIGNLPDPASVNASFQTYMPGVGVGGSYWYSDGVRWRPTSRVVLGRIAAPSSGIAQTAPQVLAETRIPAGVLQNGDMLHIYNVIGKSGTSDSVQRSIKIGVTAGATNGTLLIGANTAPGGASRSYGEELYLQRESSTSLRVKGNGSLSLPFAGASTSPAATPITVANMDSQDVYLANTITMTSGAETPSQETWIVELIASG